jgi:hypothetical protein
MHLLGGNRGPVTRVLGLNEVQPRGVAMPVPGTGALAVVAVCTAALLTACGVRSATAGASGSPPLTPNAAVTKAAGTPTASAPVP